jgi:hypothetical protein
MIYHELFGQHLRWGNFFPKFAISLQLEKKYGIKTSYPSWYYLWKYLKDPPVQHEEDPEYDVIIRPRKWEYDVFEQNWFENEVILKLEASHTTAVALNYFFQSQLAFQDIGQELLKALKFKPKIEYDLLCKYAAQMTTNRMFIVLGIRLGDFQGHGDFYQIPPAWYVKALEEAFPNWRTEAHVMVLSDDIRKAKEIFKDYPFHYAEPNQTHLHIENFKYYHGDASEQWWLGTQADGLIIGNSTFSWAQAVMAHLEGAKVVHTGKVFSPTGNMKHVDTSNFYHPDWVKIEI